MMTRELIFLSFAASAAWMDIRSRQVPLLLFLAFAIAALPFCLADGSLLSCLSGIAPGLGLLLLSGFSKGAVGAGDGLFFVVSGMYLGTIGNFCLFCAALFSGGIFSLIFFVFQRIKNGRYAGKDTLPFLPFAAIAALFLFISGNSGG